VLDMVVKMSGVNPGAVAAMVDLMEQAPSVDPESALGSLGPILSLDTYEIYGSPIYVIWSDKCGRDGRKMLMLLRAVQLGILPESKLKVMAADQTGTVDLTDEEWVDIDAKVCEQLKGFKRPE
jgi:hypothetical protein